ncbi:MULTISPECIES: ATP-binding cassette domain-containing protein [Flavobacterium]|uniref:ATP-binding cassette domain-containing protein n=1 Tax=Flavobacterium TaxID=237 RepID=UPI0026914C27|nr:MULTISPECIES: ATP-binding cassette domain-containing protein [Flavobacterium]
MRVKHGEFVSIIGKSGCGKSTLLYLLSTMDTEYDDQILIHKALFYYDFMFIEQSFQSF